MPSSQDHKRAYDGNLGPNTGGMGAFTPSPNYTPELADQCMKEIFLPTMAAMKAEGRPFKGVIYFGLMLTPQGPKVVEYNARFGDPETQAVLYQLDSDLFEIFNACVDGTLADLVIRWKPGAACCLVLASGGYPLSYEKGFEISGLDRVENATVFHAGTKFGPTGRIPHQRRSGSGRHRLRRHPGSGGGACLCRCKADLLEGHAFPYRHRKGLGRLKSYSPLLWVRNQWVSHPFLSILTISPFCNPLFLWNLYIFLFFR